MVFRSVNDKNDVKVFRNPDFNSKEFNLFVKTKVKTLIGHNFIDYDYKHLVRLIPGFDFDVCNVRDTLVMSRLYFYKRPGGHSLDAWGSYFGQQKSSFDDFSRWSQELENRCIDDTLINRELYLHLSEKLKHSPKAVDTEHFVARICSYDLHVHGFYFNIDLCKRVHSRIVRILGKLNQELQQDFPPEKKHVRDITVTFTKQGALFKRDVPHLQQALGTNDLTTLSEGDIVPIYEWNVFKPSSTKQIVERMHEAGWKPTVKTKGHIQAEKDQRQRRRKRQKTSQEEEERLERFKKYGWKVNEENLKTLPITAPKGAQKLATYLLLDARRSTLEEWLQAYNAHSHSIHGTFNPIGAWTHRFSHVKPNQGNIPRVTTEFGKIMRQMWSTPENTWLLGTDASSIQLRILAHYINDPEFTDHVVNKDIHTFNKEALGLEHITRTHAKTFIYAWLLGASFTKVAEILECTIAQAKEANENFLEAVPGLRFVKEQLIPADAKRGYFIGLDGRRVVCNSEHLMLAGYLQNGESIIMKTALELWYEQFKIEKIPFQLSNFVHDEWQTLILSKLKELAEHAGKIQVQSIVDTGKKLKLNVPLDGEFKIGRNWKETH